MSMFNKVTKTFQWGQHTVTLETGEIARQSTGAVLVTMNDTVVLATVVAKNEAKTGQDFFPLTVDWRAISPVSSVTVCWPHWKVLVTLLNMLMSCLPQFLGSVMPFQ